MELSLVDMIGIARDRKKSLEMIAEKEGYKKVIPRAEWSLDEDSLLISYPNEKKKNIPSKILESIFDGKTDVSKEDRSIIDKWYDTSEYKYGYEYKKIITKSNASQKRGDMKDVEKRRNELKALIEKKKLVEGREFIKKQLEYIYNERGERLENLYKILYGHTEQVNLRFGSIILSINSNNYLKEMLKNSYEKTRGFFEDVSNAYSFVENFKGEVEYSQSTGIAYSDELAQGIGATKITVREKPVALEATIVKDSLNDLFCLNIRTSKMIFNPKKLDEESNIILPNYAVESDGEHVTFFSKQRKLAVLYHKNEFVFSGYPSDLKEEIPKFLEAVID